MLTETKQYSILIRDVFEEFIVARRSKGVTDRTLKWYYTQVPKFIDYCETNNVTAIGQVTAQIIRLFLTDMLGRGLSDNYVNGYARQIKSLLIFAHNEGYIPNAVRFDMPKIHKKRRRVLDIGEVKQILSVCDPREKAIILLAVDTGLRLEEMINLDWDNLNIKRLSLHVLKGKGKKYRVVGIGAKVVQALIKYKRTQKVSANDTPIFQTRSGKRYTIMGFRSLLVRISDKSGVRFSAHPLRRTFARMSVRSGRDVIYIQQAMGHENIETTRNYIQDLDDEDILRDHRDHGFADNLLT